MLIFDRSLKKEKINVYNDYSLVAVEPPLGHDRRFYLGTMAVTRVPVLLLIPFIPRDSTFCNEPCVIINRPGVAGAFLQ